MTDRAHLNVRDASHIQTKALPASAGSVYTSCVVDLGAKGARDVLKAQLELLISAPALGTTPLPDTETMIYFVQMDSDVAFGSPTSVYGTVLTQTGAGSAGAAAATKRVWLPSDCERYVRVGATGSTTIGDCSGSSVTAEALF